jgi:hypothetical protein
MVSRTAHTSGCSLIEACCSDRLAFRNEVFCLCGFERCSGGCALRLEIPQCGRRVLWVESHELMHGTALCGLSFHALWTPDLVQGAPNPHPLLRSTMDCCMLSSAKGASEVVLRRTSWFDANLHERHVFKGQSTLCSVSSYHALIDSLLQYFRGLK